MSDDNPADETAHLRQRLEAAEQGAIDARRAVGLLSAIIDSLPVGVTVQSEDGAVVLENGISTDFSIATDPSDETAAPVPQIDPATEPMDTNGAITTEERVLAPQGDAGERTLLIRRRAARILDRSLLLSTSFDFTDRKRAEVELSRRAYFDDLTGLPNGTLIHEEVHRVLTVSEGKARFALALLDVDNFKHVNDYYTHAVGDKLLLKVAQRIGAKLRASDVVARLSGDEFLLVLNPLDSDEYLEDLINSLLKELKEPFLIEGYEILTSASIGVSICPDHGMNYETLRRAADTAINRVKDGAKGAAALFDSDMGRAMSARMAQEQRLRLAVRDARFCCAFQPKVDIRTQEIVGVEALIRLRDEDGVIQAPGEFIGLAIELGLIDDITYLALAEIMRSIDLLDDAFGPQATISINIAAKRAADASFMDGFCAELKATNCANRFMVEVTEDAFFSKSCFQTHFLPILREIGTRVSVDDFGTGYSSLATLADVTADEIKIDRSFITDIHQRPRSQSVLKAIEALSDALGMTVIAEGVETFEEVAYLQAATRIRFAQGYYFAKPIFLEELAPSRRTADAARSGASPRLRTPLRG
ncbi:MAG TPA: EAL domain-containing protein [Xanthobacteraceae bacterium]|nr:EAL domain-containing protein [Xanthobacteraceae bacterium]